LPERLILRSFGGESSFQQSDRDILRKGDHFGTVRDANCSHIGAKIYGCFGGIASGTRINHGDGKKVCDAQGAGSWDALAALYFKSEIFLGCAS
jgi:hypothetical protein